MYLNVEEKFEKTQGRSCRFKSEYFLYRKYEDVIKESNVSSSC